MYLAEFDRGSHIDQFDRLTGLNQIVQLLRGNGGDAHGELLVGR
jgi:hypothetical protein